MCVKKVLKLKEHHFLRSRNASTFILFPDLLHLQSISSLAEQGWGRVVGMGWMKRGLRPALLWLQRSSAGPHSSCRWHPGLGSAEHLPSLPCDGGSYGKSSNIRALVITDDVDLVPGGHRSRVKKQANHLAISFKPQPGCLGDKNEKYNKWNTLCVHLLAKISEVECTLWWKSLNLKIITSSCL